jgi:ethanolaminephosphotransferase
MTNANHDVESDRTQLLYRNAKQIKKIVEAKYTSLRFDERVMTAEDMELECFSAKVSLTHRL